MKTTIAALAVLFAAACGPAVAVPDEQCRADGGRLPVECCQRPTPRLPDAGPCPGGTSLVIVLDDCGSYSTCE